MILSPYPRTSSVVNRNQILTIDWDKWFNGLFVYVTRLLNRYDTLRSGTATLVAGTVVIANSRVTTSSSIRLTRQTVGWGMGGHSASKCTARCHYSTISNYNGPATRVVVPDQNIS